MHKIKKTFLSTLLFLAGLFLIFGGFNLIEISLNLMKYLGAGLVTVSIIYYLAH